VYDFSYDLQETDKITETPKNIGIKIVCIGCTERTLLLSFIIVLFVYCAVPMSMHYRLC